MARLLRALLAVLALFALFALPPLAAAHIEDECGAGFAAGQMSGLGSLLGRRLPPPVSCAPNVDAGAGRGSGLRQRLVRQVLYETAQSQGSGAPRASGPPPPAE